MPANIEKFYGLYKPAWHGLGYVSDVELSLADALIAGDMDYEFSTAPVYAQQMDEHGVTSVEIEGKKAVMRRNRRTNEVRAFGPTGDKYVVHDLPEIFTFADGLLSEGATVDTVGTLGRGERAFLTLTLPIDIDVNGDRSGLYLTATTGFDGSASTRYDMTPVRIVCANTWVAAHEASKSSIKFRHTSSLLGNETRAADALGLAREYADVLTAQQAQLMGISMRYDDVADVLKDLFPFPEGVTADANWDDLTAGQKRTVTKVQKERGTVFRLYNDSPVKAGETAWGVFNAVTEYTDHYLKVRGGAEASATAVLDGKFDTLKRNALDLLLV